MDTYIKKWASDFLSLIDKKMRNSIKTCDIIPYTTENGKYVGRDVNCWTNGFFGGMLWLLYNDTKYDDYRKTAENNENILLGAFDNFDKLDHDVGFMFHLTSGANYLICGNEKSRNTNLIAASILASRYNTDGNYIRAWNGDRVGYTIIDTMMNLPLLFWASKQTGDRRFAAIAEKHAEMVMRDHVRADGSVAHIVVHDEKTGEVINTLGGQGYAEGSAWSRGAAWAIYGFALAYIHTGRKDFLDTAKKAAHYFIFSVAGNGFVPQADFRAPKEPEYIDTSASAIAACGMIEIARALDENEGRLYIESAVKILEALKPHCDFSLDTDSCLQDCRESYHAENNKNLVYGDFYLVEALCKLKGNDILIW